MYELYEFVRVLYEFLYDLDFCDRNLQLFSGNCTVLWVDDGTPENARSNLTPMEPTWSFGLYELGVDFVRVLGARTVGRTHRAA